MSTPTNRCNSGVRKDATPWIRARVQRGDVEKLLGLATPQIEDEDDDEDDYENGTLSSSLPNVCGVGNRRLVQELFFFSSRAK
jgi:hypothetical protein